MVVLPAVDGVHWCKGLNGSGRPSCFCKKCDPNSSGDGYYDVGSMNRHLVKEHELRAFNSSRRRRGGGGAVGSNNKAKRGAREAKTTQRTPAKKTCGRPSQAKTPARVLRKRSAIQKEEPAPPQRRPAREEEEPVRQKGRATKDKANNKETCPSSSEDTPMAGDETPEDWPASLMKTPAAFQSEQIIAIPVCGLSNVAFKSESSSSKTSQTFEAKWFQLSSAVGEDDCCIAKMCGSPYAKFPVFGLNSKDVVFTNAKKSPAETDPGDELEEVLADMEGNGEESMRWALRPMDEIKKGDGQVPLVSYSSSSEGDD